MLTTLLSLLTLATPSADAARRADLETTVLLPAVVDVDVADTIEVLVDNVGRRTAADVTLIIALPETATSPTVHVLGDVSALDARCSEVGTELHCDLGRLRSGRSATVAFDFAAPWASIDLEIYADAETSSREDDLNNNEDWDLLGVEYVDTVITGPNGALNRHCTGSGLQAFYECRLYPSSISGHDILLEANGTITFPPGVTGYTGTWTQDTDDHLHFEYGAYGQTRLVFDGNGVGGRCFEGVSTFPGTGYNAGYEVCLK